MCLVHEPTRLWGRFRIVDVPLIGPNLLMAAPVVPLCIPRSQSVQVGANSGVKLSGRKSRSPHGALATGHMDWSMICYRVISPTADRNAFFCSIRLLLRQAISSSASTSMCEISCTPGHGCVQVCFEDREPVILASSRLHKVSPVGLSTLFHLIRRKASDIMLLLGVNRISLHDTAV